MVLFVYDYMLGYFVALSSVCSWLVDIAFTTAPPTTGELPVVVKVKGVEGGDQSPLTHTPTALTRLCYN